MASVDQKSKAGPGKGEPAPEVATLWQKLNAFGEKHVKLIIFLSSALIILTVIIFAKIFYDRTLAERAAKEVAAADSIDKLKALKDKYKDTPVAAEIIYRLANKYYEEGRLDEARKEYEEFKSRFPNHPLKLFVDTAYSGLIANKRFLDEERERRLKVRSLQSHPEERRDLKKWLSRFPEDVRKNLPTGTLFYGPEKMENPVLELLIDGKPRPIVIELFEDEAPNTVYNLVKLAEDKELEGVKFEKAGDVLKLSKNVKFSLKFETTTREAKRFCLIVRKTAERGDLPGAEIEFLLEDQPDLKDVVVIGEVTELKPEVMTLTSESAVKSVTITKKRADTKYVPERINP